MCVNVGAFVSAAASGRVSHVQWRYVGNLPNAVAVVTIPSGALEIDVVSRGRITYDVMVRVAFSPSDMGADPSEPRIPSSQPV